MLVGRVKEAESKLRVKCAAKDYTTTTTGTTTRVLLSKRRVHRIELLAPGNVRLCLRLRRVVHGGSRISYTIQGCDKSSPSIAGKVLICTAIRGMRGGDGVGSRGDISLSRGVGLSNNVKVNHMAGPKLRRGVNRTTVGGMPQEVVYRTIRRIYEGCRCAKGLRIHLSIPRKTRITGGAFGPELKVRKKVSVLKAANVIRPVDRGTLASAVCLRVGVLGRGKAS